MLHEDLTKLKETVAAHEIRLNRTSRTRSEARLRVPPTDGSYQVIPPESPDDDVPSVSPDLYYKAPPGRLYKLGAAIDDALPHGGSAR